MLQQEKHDIRCRKKKEKGKKIADMSSGVLEGGPYDRVCCCLFFVLFLVGSFQCVFVLEPVGREGEGKGGVIKAR